MISDRAREILSEGVSENEEMNVIFLDEEEGQCFVFKLFRATEGAGDTEQRAIRWLGRARDLCRTAHGKLRTGMVRSKDETSVMAALSGREIEAREWAEQTADSNRLGTARAAR